MSTYREIVYASGLRGWVCLFAKVWRLPLCYFAQPPPMEARVRAMRRVNCPCCPASAPRSRLSLFSLPSFPQTAHCSGIDTTDAALEERQLRSGRTSLVRHFDYVVAKRMHDSGALGPAWAPVPPRLPRNRYNLFHASSDFALFPSSTSLITTHLSLSSVSSFPCHCVCFPLYSTIPTRSLYDYVLLYRTSSIVRSPLYLAYDSYHSDYQICQLVFLSYPPDSCVGCLPEAVNFYVINSA